MAKSRWQFSHKSSIVVVPVGSKYASRERESKCDLLVLDQTTLAQFKVNES